MDQRSNEDQGIDWVVGLAGVLVTFAVAGLLEGERDSVGSTNVALLLGLVVVAAGVIGRRRGGCTTALGAALAFNFFHVTPVHTVRIASGRDVATVALLVVTGVLVGELSRHRQAAALVARGGRDEIRLLHANAELCRTAATSNAAILGCTEAVARLLGADSVAFEHGAGDGDRRIDQHGTLDGIPLRATEAGYDLGDLPVHLDVCSGPTPIGRFVIVPRSGRPVSLDARLGAVVVADQLALALARMAAV